MGGKFGPIMNQQNLKMLPGLTKPLTDSVQRPRLTAVGYSLMMNWCLGLYLYVTILEACVCYRLFNKAV